jgi:NADPH2:quinone reductase
VPDVTRWKIGDKICALVMGGGYAEYCSVPAGQCLPVPETLTFIEAASLPETFFTVWSNVFDRGHLKPGETCWCMAAQAGLAWPLYKWQKLGHTVYVTAGSDEKCKFCEEPGRRQSHQL